MERRRCFLVTVRHEMRSRSLVCGVGHVSNGQNRSYLTVSLLLLGCCCPPAHQAFGFDITSSALSNLPTFLPSTNPSTRPRTGVTTQAAALPHFLFRLAVHSTATSSTPIVGRLPTPSPTAPPSSARRRCSRCTAPPSSEGGDLTSPSAWRPTLRAPASRSPPPYSLVVPHGAANALVRRAS